jgi:hypothetical protein
MQSIQWYFNRLLRMSPPELAWRVGSAAQGFIDDLRFRLGWHLPEGSGFTATCQLTKARTIKLLPAISPIGCANALPQSLAKVWGHRLCQQADLVVANRLSYFHLMDSSLGDPIDWHRDHGSNISAPRSYAPAIDYRVLSIAGDCKLVWEPNRHAQFPVLARAFLMTGERKYVAALERQWNSWLDDNPFMVGMNWRSGLELGVRLVNWVITLDLLWDSDAIPESLKCRIVESIYLHCWEVARKFSRGSSSNNHLIGEAAGVFVAATYFPEMPGAKRWHHASAIILEREILNQSFADGCTREQASGYQLFVIEFFLICGLLARKAGKDFTSEYWQRLEIMIGFLGLLKAGGDSLPIFGDYDDGYVFDLGRTRRDPQDLLCIAALLFKRADYLALAPTLSEPAWWLFGAEAVRSYGGQQAKPVSTRLQSMVLEESGHVLLQCGELGSANRISVLFDCAELGLGSIAAHGHADALSFVLRAYGTDLLVDPGTYDYYTYPAWRNYFRSTRAHNTIEVDGLDQSTMLGNFMWGQRATTRLVSWQPQDNGGTACGQHDGYQRLESPLTHSRSIMLDGVQRVVVVVDELLTGGSHTITQYFHLAPGCVIERMETHEFALSCRGQRALLVMDSSLEVSLLCGSVDPMGGWVSDAYHVKQATTTLVARRAINGNSSLRTVIRLPLASAS